MQAISNHRSSPRFDAPRLVTTPPLVQASGLGKRYGAIEAVAGVNVEAYPGEVLGIVGESGSGKSTVLRLLNLEEMPDNGAYTLDIPGLAGKNLYDLDRFARREVQILNIGVVYQNPHLGLRMRFTSSGNVAERLLLTGERTFAALRQAA
ncbi:MAG: ATP-binding cassette domain-containing protein, partial [Anaerolineae bacterium]|nr:ATP-binding cassette domain-containing protein [Anaerolineae bacterium]